MQSHRSILLPPDGTSPSAQASTFPTDTASAPAQPTQSFDAATPVQTDHGMKRMDALSVGDRVLTRSGAFAPIAAIDRVALTKNQLHDAPDVAPIRFDPGALPDMPDGPATLLSPDCAVAWSTDAHNTTTFPARAFCDGGLIRRVIPSEGVTYIRLHFDAAQEICAGGIWVALDRVACACDQSTLPGPALVHDACVFRPLRE